MIESLVRIARKVAAVVTTITKRTLSPWRRHRVTVIYKSGAVMVFRCDRFKTTTTHGELSAVEWDNPRPRPLHIGVDDIAAVWTSS